MTATAGSLSRREKARGEAAAKAKRQKIILAVGGVLLLGVLAFQAPKVLKELHPSTPAAAPTGVQAPPAGKPVTHARPVDSLARIARYPAKDPFVAQLGALGKQTSPPLAHGPFVRTSHFVSKDPFVQQVSLASSRPGTAGSAAPTAAAGTTGYIVMLASVDKSDGRGRAVQAAAAARRSGVKSVQIVDSTNYGTLRSGFYAVFSGPYATLAKMRSALTVARAKGYVSAYTRRLGG